MKFFKSLNNSEKLFFLLLGILLSIVGWAAFFTVDKAIQATGELSPMGKTVVVQARQPGTVRAIHYQINDQVFESDVLFTIDADDERARLDELQTDLFSHQVRMRRAEAQLELRDYFEPLPGASSELLSDELRLLTSSLLALREDQLLLDKEVDALRSEISRKLADAQSLKSGIQLEMRRLELTQRLVDKGYEGEIALLEAQQRLEAASSQRSDALSALNTLRAELGIVNLRKQLLLTNHQKQTSAELSALRSNAVALTKQIKGLEARIGGFEVRAQVTGVISKQMIGSVGQVVAVGEPLAEIIPGSTPLVFYARIPVADIQDVALAQPVKLFLNNMNVRSTVPLAGVVHQVDPDATLDPKTSERFFIAVVKFDANQTNLQYVLPGVTGRAAILVGERTVLDYLVDPIWTQMRSSLNEPQ